MNTPDPFEVFAEQDFPLDVESVQAPEPPAPDPPRPGRRRRNGWRGPPAPRLRRTAR